MNARADSCDLYFDHAASTPTLDFALAAFEESQRRFFANPSSTHDLGRAAGAELQRLKKEFLGFLGSSDGQLILCATATEANNLCMHSILQNGGRLAISADVHASLWWATEFFDDRCDIIPLSQDGSIDMQALSDCVQDDTVLVCVPHVCHETGVMHDIKKITEFCERKELACLIDGVQAVGKMSVCLDDCAPCVYTFSAHKFGGVRGCAGLIWNDGTQAQSMIRGGAQEYGIRAGTENLAAVAAACAALHAAITDMEADHRKVTQLRQRFMSGLIGATGATCLVNESKNNSPYNSPYIVSISCAGIDAAAIIEDLSLSGIAIANGSACSAHEQAPSRIMLAMGRHEDAALGTLRISFAASQDEASIDTLLTHLIPALARSQR